MVVISRSTLSVVCFENRQQCAGTRRVQQVEHVRSPAGIIDTAGRADLQEERGRGCPVVSAITAPEPPW
jgi:hypothetical protein